MTLITSLVITSLGLILAPYVQPAPQPPSTVLATAAPSFIRSPQSGVDERVHPNFSTIWVLCKLLMTLSIGFPLLHSNIQS